MCRNLVAPALLVVAGVLSVGVSGGQVVRCLRRKKSDDVTIAGWLSGAGACACMLMVVLVTKSSLWLALWESGHRGVSGAGRCGVVVPNALGTENLNRRAGDGNAKRPATTLPIL